MEKFVEDFETCEELLAEVLEKVNLVTRNQEKRTEKGSPMVQKKEENIKNLETLEGGGKNILELKKLRKGGGNLELRIMVGRKL